MSSTADVSKFAVLIVKHDQENAYGERAFARAQEAISKTDAIELSSGVYLIQWRTALAWLVTLPAVGKPGSAERRVEYSVIPCSGEVFGELEDAAAEKLRAAGGVHFPAALPGASDRSVI